MTDIRINGRRGRDFRDKRNWAPVIFASGFRVYRPGDLFTLFQLIIRMIPYSVILLFISACSGSKNISAEYIARYETDRIYFIKNAETLKRPPAGIEDAGLKAAWVEAEKQL